MPKRHIYLPDGEYDTVESYADEHDMSFSAAIQLAIREELEGDGE